MPVYLVTGKLGSGKSLATVGRIREYLNQGRYVATNLDLNLDKMINPWSKKARAIRLPDKPTLEDLENLPEPYEGDYDESKTGAIVLDECGTWFNTREYRDKSRQPLINKLLHIRKAGWDVFFIIQHIEMIDKQVREGLGEHVVYCQRADRLGIPLITGLGKLLGMNIRPPKLHVALVKYGTSTMSPVVDRWVYNGADLYQAYDTRQVFGSNDCQMFSYLPPYLTFGRYKSKNEVAKEKTRNAINKTKSILKSAKRSFFLLGLSFGLVINFFSGSQPKSAIASESQPVKQIEPEIPQVQEINPLDFVRITAYIRRNDGFEYYFYDELSGRSVDLALEGYMVRAIDSCRAKIHKDNVTTILTCRARETKLGARDVRPSELESPSQ